MSVDIQKVDGKIYVNAKPDNAPKDSLGSAGVHIECKNEAEAKALAAKIQEMEAKIKNELAQAGPVNLNEGAKPKDVGQKLDVKSA